MWWLVAHEAGQRQFLNLSIFVGQQLKEEGSREGGEGRGTRGKQGGGEGGGGGGGEQGGGEGEMVQISISRADRIYQTITVFIPTTSSEITNSEIIHTHTHTPSSRALEVPLACRMPLDYGT